MIEDNKSVADSRLQKRKMPLKTGSCANVDEIYMVQILDAAFVSRKQDTTRFPFDSGRWS